MMIHATCKMPLEADESRIPDFQRDDVMGLYCSLCVDENGRPLEIQSDEEIETIDMEVLVK